MKFITMSMPRITKRMAGWLGKETIRESQLSLHYHVAQRTEYLTTNQRVVGSNPTVVAIWGDSSIGRITISKTVDTGSSPVRLAKHPLSSMGEHLPYKQKVKGSSPLVDINQWRKVWSLSLTNGVYKPTWLRVNRFNGRSFAAPGSFFEQLAEWWTSVGCHRYTMHIPDRFWF